MKHYGSPHILSSYIIRFEVCSIYRKIFIACRECTPAALSLCLPEATWSVLMKSSKHPANSIMFSIVSHGVGGFQDVAIDWRKQWHEWPKISLHRGFRLSGIEEWHRRGMVLFWLLCRMVNTCAGFLKFHSESSCLFMRANVFNWYLAEERHSVSRFSHAVLNLVMEWKRHPMWFHFWMKTSGLFLLTLCSGCTILQLLLLLNTVFCYKDEAGLLRTIHWFVTQSPLYVAGIQEGTECTKCKNDWALRAAIALLYVLCALLTIAVAVLGYKGKSNLKSQIASCTIL